MPDDASSVGPTGILGGLLRVVRSAVRGFTLAAFQAEVNRAEELIARGDHAGARERLETLVRVGASSEADRPSQATEMRLHQAVALALLSEAYAAEGADERAQSAAAKSVEVFATLDMATAAANHIEWYVTALRRIGRRQQAVDALREAYRRREHAVRLAPMLADWLAEAGEPAEAVDVLLRAASRDPIPPEEALPLAEALERHGMGAAAGEVFGDAGIALQLRGRLDEARHALGRAWHLVPDNAILASAYAIALASEDPVEARFVLDTARERLGEDPNLYLAQAALLRAEGQHEEALRELDRVEKLSSSHPALPGARGYLYYTLGDYDQAEKHLRQAVALTSEPDVGLLSLLGDVLRRRRDLEEAEELLNQAVQLAPAYSEARAALVRTHLDMGNPDKASRVLRRAPAVDELLARVHGEVAEQLRLAEKYDLALQHLDVALRPEFAGMRDVARHLATRGQVMDALGRRSEAIDDLARALRGDPLLRWALAELQQVLEEATEEERDRALAALDDALVERPDAPASWRAQLLRCKAQLLQDRGRFDEAATALAAAVALDGESADLWAELGENRRLANDPRGALRALNTALKLNSKHDSARASRGAVRAELGHLDGAERDLRAVLNRVPDYTWAAAILGNVLVAKGKHSEAIAELARVLTYDPHNVVVRRSLGYALVDSDRAHDALAAFQQALEISPGDLEILNDIAWANLRLEDYPSALEVLDQALSLDPEDVTTLVTKADVLNELGEYEEALPLVDKALAKDSKFADGYNSRGWALTNSGIDHVEEARRAYARSLRLQESPWVRKELANCLRALRRPTASSHYERALKAMLKSGRQNAATLSDIGWCNYGLARYDEALRYYDLALHRRHDASTQLDVALTLLCRGDGETAIDEYQRCLSRVGRQWIRRQRGLLCVALNDLRQARQALSLQGEAAQTCEEMVARALDEQQAAAAGAVTATPAEAAAPNR